MRADAKEREAALKKAAAMQEDVLRTRIGAIEAKLLALQAKRRRTSIVPTRLSVQRQGQMVTRQYKAARAATQATTSGSDSGRLPGGTAASPPLLPPLPLLTARSKLGNGGFGDVHLAYHTVGGVRVEVAVKVPGAERNANKYLQREAQLLMGALRGARGCNQVWGMCDIVLEDGGTTVRKCPMLELLPVSIASAWDGSTPKDPRCVLRYTPPRSSVTSAVDFIAWLASQLKAALTEVHSRGWVHGDVNPSNIMFQPERDRAVVASYTSLRLVLIDFGLSRGLRTTNYDGGQEFFAVKSFLRTNRLQERLRGMCSDAAILDWFGCVQTLLALAADIDSSAVQAFRAMRQVPDKCGDTGAEAVRSAMGARWLEAQGSWLAVWERHDASACGSMPGMHSAFCQHIRTVLARTCAPCGSASTSLSAHLTTMFPVSIDVNVRGRKRSRTLE